MTAIQEVLVPEMKRLQVTVKRRSTGRVLCKLRQPRNMPVELRPDIIRMTMAVQEWYHSHGEKVKYEVQMVE